MLFVTVGSQKFQFNRLLQAIDSLIEQAVITDEVFAQIGYSDYNPKHFGYTDFLNRDEFEEKILKADIIITHGGTGVIIKSVKIGKKVIAVPRLVKYREHVDNHQMQLISEFQKANMIISCLDISKLADALKRSETFQPFPYQSNSKKIMENVEEFLSEIKS